MTGIHELGFLGSEITEVVAIVEHRYKRWLDIFEAINLVAWGTQYNFKVHKDDPQEVLMATAYARTLTNTQAVIILAKRGMDTQARVMLRAALEVLFTLKAIAKSRDFALKFMAADDVAQGKVFNKLKTWIAASPQEKDTNEAIDRALAENKKAIQNSGARRISTEEVSKVGELHSLYLTAYSHFSASVHSNVRDLERHFVVDSDKDISEIRNEPELDNLGILFSTASEIILIALAGIAELLPISIEQFLEVQYQALNELPATPD